MSFDRFAPQPVDTYDDLPLFAPPPAPERAQAIDFDDDLRRAAHKWMEDHPDAMELFERLSLSAAAKGRRFGIAFVRERIRWEYAIERGDGEFKIPNNHSPYIARELIRRHPHLADHIETHRTKDEAA